jgi:hypothetical protein
MPETAPGSQTQPASEHEGLAQTIDPRALEVGKQVIGEQGQHLTIERIDTTKRTWHFFVKDPDTGVTLKITEASMKKLLKAQHEVLSKENGSKVPPDDTPKPEGTESPSIDEKGSEKKQGKKKVPEKDSTTSTPKPEPSAPPEQSTPKAPVEPTPPTSQPAKESKEQIITGWKTIGIKFPQSARVLLELSNLDLPAEDFLRIIDNFNAKRPEPTGGYSLREKRLSNGRRLTFMWKNGRVRIEGKLSRKEAIPEPSAPSAPGEKTKAEEPAAASAEEPAPEAGTGAAPETPKVPKTPEEVLEQVYESNPDFKEAVEALKNPDLSADDFVSKLTEFNTRTPLNRSPQKFKYELPSGRVVIAMWDSEGNVGIGGQLTDDENHEAGEPEPVPEAGTAGPEPTAAAEPEAEPTATPTPEAEPKPLKISAELKGKLEDARVAFAKDLAHNRTSEKSLGAYEIAKSGVLYELNQNIFAREKAGEKLTPELLHELVSLTLTNEALQLSLAVRYEKGKVGTGWKERTKHWWRSESARKIRLAASFALLGVGAAAASGGVAPLATGALALRGLLAAGGMAEIVQRFYEITLKGKAEKALEKTAGDMSGDEIIRNLAVTVLSEQTRETVTQNQLNAIEKEIADRITKKQIEAIKTKLKEVNTDIGLELNSLFDTINTYLSENVKAIQKEQEAQAKGWKRVRIVGLAAATAFGVAAAMGAGAEHAPTQIGKSFIGGWVGGLLFRSGLGGFLKSRGVPESKTAKFSLIAGIAGALVGGAAANEIGGAAHVETATGHETPAAVPETTHAEPPVGTTPEAQPPVGESSPGPAPDANAPATPGATPEAQPETPGATPPVTSEATPGQPEVATPPATVEFNAQAPVGNTENGSITWGGHTLEMKDGVAHNVGVDLSGDGVADKNIDIKIDDFKTGHGTLTSDVLNDKGEVVYEKGTVVQVWDKDWNNTASGDAGLVARMNVMKDLDGDGKFETQIGFDKNGDLHWTHQESVQAKWDDTLNATDFKTADGHLDNFAKGPDSFGFQGFEITGDTQTEMAHSLAEQWAALHGEASAPAELVTQFNDALTAHPDLYMAHRPDLYPTHSTDRVWSTQDVKSLGVTFEKETQVQPETTQTTETNLQQKYGEYIKDMQRDTWDKEKSIILNFLNQKEPAEFKGVDDATRSEILNAINSGVKPDVYVGLTNGVPDKYFIHLNVGGKEYAAVIKPSN